MPVAEFVRRFGLLADITQNELSAENILTTNEIDPTTYRIGPSQVSEEGMLSDLN